VEGTIEDVTGQVQTELALDVARRQLELVHDIAMSAASTLSIQEVQDRIVAGIFERVAVDSVELWSVDYAQDRLILAARRPYLVVDEAETEDFQNGEAYLSVVARTGEPLVINDTLMRHPQFPRGRHIPGIRCVGAFPLPGRDSVIGVLCVGTAQANGLGPTQQEFLQSVAREVGIALENARLFEQVGEVESLRHWNARRDEFLSMMSHELRTPLTSVIGYSELLTNKEYPSERVRELCSRIYTESRRLAEMLNNILDVSRLEGGFTKARPEEVKIAEVLADRREFWSGLTKKHDIILDCADMSIAGFVDKGLLIQAVDNLVSNAIKYSPDGGMVRLAASRHGDTVELMVEDQGPGIAPEDLPNLFQKFFRGRAENGFPKGAGLGLAIVKAIVEVSGGNIQMGSTLGKGTVFRVTLPMVTQGA
jgi:signal transduction histidine kinase